MSTFAELAAKPSSTKIILCEIDIGLDQSFWTNWRAGSWFVNFDVNYPDVASIFLSGIEAVSLTQVGSVTVDGAILTAVASAADVQTSESSFFYDGGTKNLYIHIAGHDEPSLHRITLGISYGVSNHAGALNNWGVYNGYHYEPRILSIPAVAKRRDPVFFGKIAFQGGTITIDNADGAFDRFAEDRDVYGAAVRLLLGFDDLPYAEYRRMFSGYVENVTVTQTELRLDIQDARKKLSKRLPENVFRQAVYPYLADKNEGKPIPLLYGLCRNVPITCINEDESPRPQYFTFKICDTTYHAILSIDAAYNDDEEVTIKAGSKDTAAATFQLETGNLTYVGLAGGPFQVGERIKGANSDASAEIARDTGAMIVFDKRPKDPGFDVGEIITGADSGATATITAYHEGEYYPGDNVSADAQGYVFLATSILIDNALEVIVDPLTSYYPIYYNANYFNLDRWPTAKAPDIEYFLDSPKEVIDIIEEISSTIFGLFIVEDDGRYAYRIYNPNAVSLQTIAKEEILNLKELEIGYDSTEVLTSARVGYDKDWKNGEYLIELYNDEEEDVFNKFRLFREDEFLTLLNGQAAAHSFGETLFLLSGDVKKPVTIVTKMQAIEREVGDFIDAWLDRVSGTMLGRAKCEILGIEKDGNEMLVRLECRIVSLYPATIYEQSWHYDDTYYNLRYYGTTQEREIA
jgi:hypothetical protein